MARSRARATTTSDQSRRPTARSRKASTTTTEVEIVEEDRGLGIDDGIAIVTTIVLLVSIGMVDYASGKFFDSGWFF